MFVKKTKINTKVVSYTYNINNIINSKQLNNKRLHII